MRLAWRSRICFGSYVLHKQRPRQTCHVKVTTGIVCIRIGCIRIDCIGIECIGIDWRLIVVNGSAGSSINIWRACRCRLVAYGNIWKRSFRRWEWISWSGTYWQVRRTVHFLWRFGRLGMFLQIQIRKLTRDIGNELIEVYFSRFHLLHDS